MKPRTITATIVRLERKPSSASANPRYEVVFADGTSAPTAEDSTIAYAITNSEYRDVPVTFELDHRGHIVAATPAGAS